MSYGSTFNGHASQNFGKDAALDNGCSFYTRVVQQPLVPKENVDLLTPLSEVFSNRLNKVARNITRKETGYHYLCNTEADKSDNVFIFTLKKFWIRCLEECDAVDCEVNNLSGEECEKYQESAVYQADITYTPDRLDGSDESDASDGSDASHESDASDGLDGLDGSDESDASDGSDGSEAQTICLHYSLSSAHSTNAQSTDESKEDKDNKTVGEGEKREEANGNVSQRLFAAISVDNKTKSFFSDLAAKEQAVLLTFKNKDGFTEETSLELLGEETNKPSIFLEDKRPFMASHRGDNYDVATGIHLVMPASKGNANSSSSIMTLSLNNVENADDHFEEDRRNRYSIYRGLTYEMGESDGPDISKNIFYGHIEYVPMPTPITEPFLLHKNLNNLSKKETMRYEEMRLASFHGLSALSAFAIRLAMSGFYYDEEIDEIFCFSCSKCKRHWERSEYPPFVHLQISPNCKHANFQDETNVPIDIKNYTLLKDSMKSQALQGTEQKTTGDTCSSALSSMAETDSGFESEVEPGQRIEPVLTLEKRQMHLLDDHADERSDALGGSSLSSLSSPPQFFKGAASSSSLSSFSSKPGSGDDTAPPEIRFNTNKIRDFVPSSPQVIQVYTTLMPLPGSSNLEGKRFPVQAQQPAAFIYSYPLPESGRPVGSRDFNQRDVIPDPLTPGLDMRLAASPMNCRVMIRLMSFENSWSMLSTGQSPKDLALAGFYYLGAGDSVRCFYCAITLREWKPGDDPWVVHVLARFSCEYIKAVKGDDFIMQTLIGHSKGRSLLSAGDRQTQLQSPSTSPARIQPVQTPTSVGQLTLDAKTSTNGDRSSRSPGQLSLTASSNASVTSSASTTMIQQGENNTGLVSSPDVREKVRTRDDLQADCATTDRNGLNPSLSSTTTCSGGASAVSTQSSANRLTPLNPNPDADLRRLVETNRRLRERRTCRLCRQRTVDTIFLPCGHICTCESCAKSIKICIMCRKSIRGTAHVYLD